MLSILGLGLGLGIRHHIPNSLLLCCDDMKDFCLYFTFDVVVIGLRYSAHGLAIDDYAKDGGPAVV